MAIGRTNVSGSGGGGGLNLKVTAYSELPETGKENEIAVITDTPMTGYVMQAEQPTGTEGLVWIQVGDSSTAPIWVDKKQTVQIYPITVSQYIGGAWASVTAYATNNGVWNDFTRLYVYKAGNTYESLTGGWTGNNITFNSIYITFGGTIPPNVNWYCRTTNKILVRDKKTLVFDLDVSELGNTAVISCLRVGLSESTNPSSSTNNYVAYMNIPVQSFGTLPRQELELDVSGLTGEYYPIIYIRNGNASGSETAVINLFNAYFK